MESYVSFPNYAVLSSVALPEGFLEDQLETIISRRAQPAPTDSPIEEAATEEATLVEEAAMEEAIPVEEVAVEEAGPIERPQEEPSTSQIPSRESVRRGSSPIQFIGWREVLHPSRLVNTARQTPPIPQESRWRPHSKSSGEGEPNTKEQRSVCGLKVLIQSPHCQLGHWKLHGK